MWQIVQTITTLSYYILGSLPQKETNAYVLEKRKLEVEQNRSKFSWMPKPELGSIDYGFPRHLPAATVEELPLIFSWSDIRTDNFDEANSVAAELVRRNVAGRQKGRFFKV